MRLLVMGASESPVCGLRDYNRVLQMALGQLGVEVETTWLERDSRAGFRAMISETRAWSARVRSAVAHLRPDWVLWHYVPMTYGYRGVPYLVPFAIPRLARSDPPLVPLLHELIYPWGRRGWKGAVYAATTRAALFGVLRASSGVVVTTEERQKWLERCQWAPRRPVGLTPVFSNIPVMSRGPRASSGEARAPALGVFGFGSEGYLVDVVTAAVAILRTRGLPARLVLIGSPGPVGSEGERWRESAQRYGGFLPEFTGVLEPGPLSAALSDLDILLQPDEAGPTSRRSTLAAGLAHGLPIVGFDTPTAWQRLVHERAAALVPPSPRTLAHLLEGLLRDGAARAELGARAARFYAAHLDPSVVAGRLLTFLRQLRAGGARCGSLA